MLTHLRPFPVPFAPLPLCPTRSLPPRPAYHHTTNTPYRIRMPQTHWYAPGMPPSARTNRQGNGGGRRLCRMSLAIRFTTVRGKRRLYRSTRAKAAPLHLSRRVQTVASVMLCALASLRLCVGHPLPKEIEHHLIHPLRRVARIVLTACVAYDYRAVFRTGERDG